MLLTRSAKWMATMALLIAATAPALGQDYPNKVIRVIAPEAGGGGDLVVRIIAQSLSSSVGQQVIVDNRGGNGVIAGEAVAKAPADGYTLLFHGSTIWLLPFLQDRVSFDPVTDFRPITLTNRQPNILVVHPSLAAQSVKELVALAKAQPGKLSYSTSGTASSNHLAAELFKSMAGVNIVRVNYKGASSAINAILGNEVQVAFATAISVEPHIKLEKLRALGVTSAQPSALAPGLPTMSASGLPGYESTVMLGMFAPANTPAVIVQRLNKEIVQVLGRPDVKEKLFNLGVEPVGSTAEQFAATVKAEMQKWGKVIKEAGIRSE